MQQPPVYQQDPYQQPQYAQPQDMYNQQYAQPAYQQPAYQPQNIPVQQEPVQVQDGNIGGAGCGTGMSKKKEKKLMKIFFILGFFLLVPFAFANNIGYRSTHKSNQKFGKVAGIFLIVYAPFFPFIVMSPIYITIILCIVFVG
ncbi:hypothetical protein QTN25_000274 [Entamoeba marina]